MSWLRQAFVDLNVRVRSLFGRRKMRARMDEEMRMHVEMREARLVAGGATPAQARRLARREFGNMAALRDSAADMWKYGTVERLLQDVRYEMRTLRRSPGFTAIAVGMLALGIGVNATVFSFLNSYFLRPLNAAEPSRLVRVYSNRHSNTSHRLYRVYRDRQSTLESLAAAQGISVGLRIDGDIEHAFGLIASGNVFSTLGVGAARGRVLEPSDDRPDAPPIVVLAHAFWRQRFGASPDVIGRTIAINDRVFTIVGVTAEGFTGITSPITGNFWVPLSADAHLRPMLEESRRLESLTLQMIGRLKPGSSIDDAQADLDRLGREARGAAGRPDDPNAVSVYAAKQLHPEIAVPIGAFIGVLMVVVAVMLLIVCANVANLVLARAAGRGVELAIRQSIGAGRGRLIRQLLTENFVLAMMGALAGLVLAYWATLALVQIPIPTPVPMQLELAIDWRVLVFTTLAAMTATLVFGAAPAFGASRVDLVRVLKGVGGADRRQGRARAGFLVAQVALSVLLLVTAGLFILAARAAQSTAVGFDGSRVLTASVNLEARGYTEDRGRAFMRTLVERLEATPGIEAASVVDIVPLTLSNAINFVLRDGDVATRDQPPPMPRVYVNGVGPGHFRTLGIALVDGRDFDARDTAESQRVVIVNEKLARQFWPGERAIGKRLRPAGLESQNDPRRAMYVIGVARDSKYVTVGEDPTPFLYRPLTQAYTHSVTMLVRTAGGAPRSALPSIASVIREIDPGLPVFGVQTMDEATSISLLPAKIAGRLLAALGLLALALSALGTYGVLSFLVRSRAREIAIRLAIGASPGEVAAGIVRQSLKWTTVGAIIGAGMALGLTRFLAAYLHGVSPIDVRTFASVVALIAIVACAAAFVPAWRASRQDPLVTLRDA